MNPVFLDTETTGLGGQAEIVEFCVLDTAGNKLVDTLVRPRSAIPPDAERLHGISNAMVAGASTWLQVWPGIQAVLQGKLVGIFNVEFDLKMMHQSHLRNGLAWRPPTAQFFDIMKMYSDFAGQSKWQRLEQAARQCGIAVQDTHRAYQDAQLARAVFMHLAGLDVA